MQRVAAGVVQELGHRPAGQVTDAECPGHGHQLLGPQAVQAQAGGPVVAPGEAAPCLAQAAQLIWAGRHQSQHPVGLHPPQGEQKSLGRGLIAPVQVVDHHHDDPVTALQVAESLHQLRADGQRVSVCPLGRTGSRRSFDERRPGTRQKLVDHSPGQEHLRLVTDGPQQANVPVPGDEARDQAGLSDPRLTLDQHHPGPAAPHSPHLGVENRQLARPANEMVHFSSVDTTERLTQTPARLLLSRCLPPCGRAKWIMNLM